MYRTRSRLVFVVLLSLSVAQAQPAVQYRWLFFWQDMSNPVNVDRMVARFQQAQADGYNGVVFSPNIPFDKAPALQEAARKHGIDIMAIVMNGTPDRNYEEGVLCQDALFVAKGGLATLRQDNHTQIVNAGLGLEA